jgi:hypothetical protein
VESRMVMHSAHSNRNPKQLHATSVGTEQSKSAKFHTYRPSSVSYRQGTEDRKIRLRIGTRGDVLRPMFKKYGLNLLCQQPFPDAWINARSSGV